MGENNHVQVPSVLANYTSKQFDCEQLIEAKAMVNQSLLKSASESKQGFLN